VTEQTKNLLGRLSERKGEIEALMESVRDTRAEKKVLRKLKERKRSISRVMNALCEMDEERFS
jgi:DNA-binding FrmR family transcriptional regulator